MNGFDILLIGIVAWMVQGFFVTMAIGFVTGFGEDPSPTQFTRLGLFWPILGAWWLIRGPVWFIIQAIGLFAIAAWSMTTIGSRSTLVKRCETQHALYIRGLMDDDDEAYNAGLYGIYQPEGEEK